MHSIRVHNVCMNKAPPTSDTPLVPNKSAHIGPKVQRSQEEQMRCIEKSRDHNKITCIDNSRAHTISFV